MPNLGYRQTEEHSAAISAAKAHADREKKRRQAEAIAADLEAGRFQLRLMAAIAELTEQTAEAMARGMRLDPRARNDLRALYGFLDYPAEEAPE